MRCRATQHSSRSRRAGFTLLELLIFSGLFVVVALAFVGILVSVSRVYIEQTTKSEVNQQSQFVLQTIQRYVEESSLIEEPANDGDTGTLLKLRMPDSARDPVYIHLEGDALYLKEGDPNPPQPGNPATYGDALTTDLVLVSDVTFTKRSRPGAKASVDVAFTVTYNTQNPRGRQSQGVQIGVARVSAATFDSDIYPNADRTFDLGVNNYRWNSINNHLYFYYPSGNKFIGIGTAFPERELEIDGGLRLNTTKPRPACTETIRGTLWVTQNPAGTPDSVAVCVHDGTVSTGTPQYSWQSLYP